MGDNLEVIREYIKSDSVDLIYLDPPFASDANYRYINPTSTTNESSVAFSDIWHWSAETDDTLLELLELSPKLGAVVKALSESLQFNKLAAYLVMMSIRLLELKRVLKPTGSIYLHCDISASSYLKIIMDIIFGAENFRNEIAWKRTSSHNDSKKWAHIHDTLLFYAGSGFTWNPLYLNYDEAYLNNFYRFEDDRGRYRLHEIIRTASMGERPNLVYDYKGYTPRWGWRMVKEKVEALDAENRLYWSKTGRPYVKKYLHEQKGTPCSSLWLDISPLSHAATEKVGYPTQKPISLLSRIISASSNIGDVVLDPFAGCGTATDAAQRLERSWIGIDISELATSLMKNRLLKNFPNIDFEYICLPKEKTIQLQHLDCQRKFKNSDLGYLV